LVSILGIPGIGKTTVTKSVALFLEDREKYSDGCIYVSMHGRFQANMLISSLLHIIKKKETSDILEKLNRMTKNIKKQEEYLPVPCEHENSSIKIQELINEIDLEKIITCLSSRTVLIILDNIEDPLRDDEQNFR
jgi:hypothetical protein